MPKFSSVPVLTKESGFPLDVHILHALFRTPGAFVSGADLAADSGVSRTAIKKHMDGLVAAGYPIEAQPHHGYRLVDPPDVWCADEICARLFLAARSELRPIDWRPVFFSATASTNDLAAREGQQAASEGLVVCADEQTSGRGRQGRSWNSPPGSGIWASLLLRPDWPPSQVGRLTLLAAVALAEGIEAAVSSEERLIDIKWPNDLQIRGRKLGGILTEAQVEPDRIRFAVVGFGINVNRSETEFPEELRSIATSLQRETGSPRRRADVFLACLLAWERCLAEPFEQVRQRWLDRCITLGREVTVLSRPGEPLTGLAQGIDSDGALLLEIAPGEVERITSGDVLHSPDDPWPDSVGPDVIRPRDEGRPIS